MAEMRFTVINIFREEGIIQFLLENKPVKNSIF